MTEADARTGAGASDVNGRSCTVPVGRLLAQTERLLARRTEAALAPHGLTVDQWRVLDLLSDGEGHTMSEIGRASCRERV